MPLTSERVIVPALDARDELINGYKRGFDRTFEAAAEDLAWFERDDLFASGSTLALHVEDGEVTAGFHYKRDDDERGPAMKVHGLFSFAQTKGATQAVLAEAILHEHEGSAEPIATKASVRIRPDDKVNTKAIRFFTRFGFQADQFNEQPLSVAGNYRHLWLTAHRDVLGRPYVRSLELYLSATDALPAAHNILVPGWLQEMGVANHVV